MRVWVGKAEECVQANPGGYAPWEGVSKQGRQQHRVECIGGVSFITGRCQYSVERVERVGGT